jgi:hypothetical protein
MIKQLLEIYPDEETGRDDIMQDSANGKLDKFLKNEALISFAFENGYPLVVDVVPPENITRIWKFLWANDDFQKLDIAIPDAQDGYYETFEIEDKRIGGDFKFNPKYWERIK